MREHKDAEQDRADEHSRSKDAQMAHGGSMQRDERKERANRSDVTHDKRREDLFKRLAHRSRITLMHK